jgi:nicotinamidase-related amidase
MTAAELLPVGSTALVTNECQNGAIGADALWGALAKEAQHIVPNLARLLAAARSAAVPVIQFVAVRREDLRGANRNAPLFEVTARAGGLRLGTSAVELVPELGPDDVDHVVPKTHGLASFRTTGADATLRNLGVTTIVLTGVSMNVAIPSLAFEAVNLGYRVVIPRDAVAGVPPEFADDVLDHSLSLVAEIVTTDELLSAWNGAS